jgi:hypothetical protein
LSGERLENSARIRYNVIWEAFYAAGEAQGVETMNSSDDRRRRKHARKDFYGQIEGVALGES